jgi:hypothetical protein
MTQSSCDRYYLAVPSLCRSNPQNGSPCALQDEDGANARAVLRAGLLYIAGDLRNLANAAPIDRQEQLLALSALVTAIAAR